MCCERHSLRRLNRFMGSPWALHDPDHLPVGYRARWTRFQQTAAPSSLPGKVRPTTRGTCGEAATV
jgi:hypothetical protein